MKQVPGVTQKLFKDAVESHREPAELLGTWMRDGDMKGGRAYGSTSIYFTHIVRVEKGSKVEFVYDPGKVLRNQYVR